MRKSLFQIKIKTVIHHQDCSILLYHVLPWSDCNGPEIVSWNWRSNLFYSFYVPIMVSYENSKRIKLINQKILFFVKYYRLTVTCFQWNICYKIVGLFSNSIQIAKLSSAKANNYIITVSQPSKQPASRQSIKTGWHWFESSTSIIFGNSRFSWVWHSFNTTCSN